MMNCKHCGQDIHEVHPWETGDFEGRWANPFGFPWCPGGGGPLQPHEPVEDDAS